MSTLRYLPGLLALALIAGCNGHGEHFTLISAGSTSIDNGAIKVTGDKVTLHADHAAPATITSKGDFAVDGQPVEVPPAQRALLLQYYAGAIGVREHGIATGMAGVAIAGEAIKGAVAGDDDKSVGARVQAKVQRAAMKICDDLASIRAAQDQLANQLPAFKPYCEMITADSVDDCRKDDN